MDCIATRIPYRQTNAFSNIMLDYIDQSDKLKPFFTYPPNLNGIQKAVQHRKDHATDRESLVIELSRQYTTLRHSKQVSHNINLLSDRSTFTVTTAHQPNIFTGPLYFIYKILHTIRLSQFLNESLKGNKFVPVFYMGSEDADLDELGNFYINGEKYTWNTSQKGAVGRMKVDKELIKLMGTMEGQLSVLPSGKEIVELVKQCYKEGEQVQDATFRFVNELFGEFGLIVLIPDNPGLKKLATKVFEDDLLNQSASEIVNRSIEQLKAAGYKAQAQPRDINLFYLVEGSRERIIAENGSYKTGNKKFTKQELLAELKEFPDRFSPNVILRGVYQELILPNIIFVGGGGELAYWLQYRDLFDHYKIPFPILLLRNSFLVVEKKWREKIAKTGLRTEDLFKPTEELVNMIVQRESKNKVKLNGVFDQTVQFYDQLKRQTQPIDETLVKHIEALKTKTIHRLQELEKKMLRAEKRKFSDQQRQVQAIKERLFPNNGLQERVDNFLPYYAKWGKNFINKLYENSLALEQEFVIVEES